MARVITGSTLRVTGRRYHAHSRDSITTCIGQSAVRSSPPSPFCAARARAEIAPFILALSAGGRWPTLRVMATLTPALPAGRPGAGGGRAGEGADEPEKTPQQIVAAVRDLARGTLPG